MLTQFMSEWFAETRRWVDAVLKVFQAEGFGQAAVIGEVGAYGGGPRLMVA